MYMEITIPGVKRAEAHFDGISLRVGGDEPSPLDLFIASLGTCSAMTVSYYCSQRGLPIEGMSIRIAIEENPDTELISTIKMELVLPRDFPKARESALIAAAKTCYVKKHLEFPPQMVFSTTRDSENAAT